MTAAVCLLFVLVPRAVAAQASVPEQAPRTPDDNWLRRLSVHLAAGATIPSGNDGRGTVQSVSIGYSPMPKLTVLVSGGRTDRPAHVRRFPDGFYVEPGGTLQFASGEVRFALRSFERVSPYALAGAGFGVWRRTEAIAEPLTNPAQVVFAGGGLVVPLGPHLRMSGDMGFLLLIERDVPH
jgi:hypothetical protein